jgi:tetratricopeptide (TPR) repeat protein
MEAYRRAIALGEQVLATHPEFATISDPVGMAHFYLGMELRKQGHDDEAEESFRASDRWFVRAVEIAPNTLLCRQHLAWLLAFCPDKQFRPPTRAVRVALSVVEMPEAWGRDRKSFSEGIRPKFSEGLAHYRAGNPTLARAALKKSIERRQWGDAYEWFVMAIIAAREGDKETSQREYERAVEWTKWNRYSDTELLALEAELADALGQRTALGGRSAV